MELKLYAKARDKQLYYAEALYCNGKVILLAGSKINLTPGPWFIPTNFMRQLREDTTLYDKNGITINDITFNSLSAAATFLTGRTANGLVCWKTEDGKNVRNTLKKKKRGLINGFSNNKSRVE